MEVWRLGRVGLRCTFFLAQREDRDYYVLDVFVSVWSNGLTALNSLVAPATFVSQCGAAPLCFLFPLLLYVVYVCVAQHCFFQGQKPKNG